MKHTEKYRTIKFNDYHSMSYSASSHIYKYTNNINEALWNYTYEVQEQLKHRKIERVVMQEYKNGKYETMFISDCFCKEGR